MTTTGKVERLLVGNINPQRRINILLKDTDNNIIYTETIDYNEKDFKSCFDIAKYICNKFDYKPGLYCNYDATTQSRYIFN